MLIILPIHATKPKNPATIIPLPLSSWAGSSAVCTCCTLASSAESIISVKSDEPQAGQKFASSLI